MASKLFSANSIKKNWLAISLFIIGVIMITITLFHGGVGGLTPIMLLFFMGLIFLFIALLNPWGGKSWKYYIILLAVLIFISILPLFIGEKYDLVQIQSRLQIPGHWAEDMIWSIGFILFAGYLAGIIGFFTSLWKNR
jgi:hypothetical protein